MKKTLWRLLAVLALCCVAAAKKQPELTVRFYTEVSGHENNSFSAPVQLQYPPRQGYISRIPNISERNIRAIYLFLAANGTFGCSFVLDEDGRVALDTLSVEKRGTSLVALVNGRQVVDMLIDKHITDGVVTIQQGLTIPEVKQLKAHFRMLNPKSTKK